MNCKVFLTCCLKGGEMKHKTYHEERKIRKLKNAWSLEFCFVENFVYNLSVLRVNLRIATFKMCLLLTVLVDITDINGQRYLTLLLIPFWKPDYIAVSHKNAGTTCFGPPTSSMWTKYFFGHFNFSDAEYHGKIEFTFHSSPF